MALRDFEREMCQRTARKVELSHESARVLHSREYIEPAFHVRHKGQKLAHIRTLRAEGVRADAACVSPEHLEIMAFGRQDPDLVQSKDSWHRGEIAPHDPRTIP